MSKHRSKKGPTVFTFTHKFGALRSVCDGGRLLSPVHTDRNNNHWQIKLYPGGRKCEFCGNSLCRKHASHMSLYLVAANCENLPELDWWKTVKCRMSVSKVSETGKKIVVYDKEIDKRKFDCNHLDWGWSEFVSFEEATKLRILNSAVIVTAEVTVLEQDGGMAPTLTFTHKFDNLSASDPGSSVLSPVHKDEDNSWRITLYPQGKGVARLKHMSVYLQAADCDDLPLGWWKSVSYRISLLPQPFSMKMWLRGLQLVQYSEAFEQTIGDDLKTLLQVDKTGLEELGVNVRSHHAKLLKAIAALQGVGHAQVVRKASNREKFNTGHQRWGWTKFVSLEEALPCIMGDSVLIQVEVAVREQDVGEASTFTFSHSFAGLSNTEPGDRLLSKVHTDNEGHAWQASLYPSGNSKALGSHMSVYLIAPNCDDLPVDWWTSVKYRFTLVNTKTNHALRMTAKNEFESGSNEWGWQKFLSLEEASKTFIVDDSVLLKTEVVVLEEEAGEAPSFTFEHKFSGLSATGKHSRLLSTVHTDDDGNSYYTLLYPTGDGDAHESHMSLYLAIANRDDEPLDWWKQCRYRLTLIHPKTGETRKKAGTNEFDSDCRNWGWRDFVSLSEASRKFIVDDSVIVKAEIAVQDDCSSEPTVSFIHKFTGVSQVEKGAKLVSPVHTDDDGDTWQTTLYPTGDTEADRGDRMAIYLAAPNCDQLRGPGWWKSVRYRVSLVDTNSPSQKLKVWKVAKCKFESASVTETEGIHKPLSLEDITDDFLNKDSLVLRTEILTLDESPGTEPFTFSWTFKNVYPLSRGARMNTKAKPKVLVSDVFTEGEGENASSWRLIFYPYGHAGSANTHIAVFIQAMNIDDSRIDWWKAANYRISFVDSKNGNVSKVMNNVKFSSEAPLSGISALVEFGRIQHAFEPGTTNVTLQAEIAVLEQNKGVLPTYSFTHRFTGISSIKRQPFACLRSDVNVDKDGNKWRVLLYPRGTGPYAGYTSIHIEVANHMQLKDGWQKRVHCRLWLLRQRKAKAKRDSSRGKKNRSQALSYISDFDGWEGGETYNLAAFQSDGLEFTSLRDGISKGFSQEVIVFTRANIRMGWRMARTAIVHDLDEGFVLDDSLKVMCELSVVSSNDGEDKEALHTFSFSHTFHGLTAKPKGKGTNSALSKKLHHKAGRMLSSAPYDDSENNEWTLSLLPYGLADFAPKDLQDKATVNMRFHLPLVCVVLMPVNLEFFETWSKTARVTITLLNPQAGKNQRGFVAPERMVRRSIQQFSSQLTKQVQWLYGIRFVHLDELLGYQFVKDGKLSVNVTVETLSEEYGRSRLPDVMAIGPYASSTHTELQEVLMAMEGMLQALQSKSKSSRESVKKHITTLLRGYGMGVPARLGLTGVISLLKEEMEREMAARDISELKRKTAAAANMQALTQSSREPRKCSLPSCNKHEQDGENFGQCARCKSAFYCCRDHQRMHWKKGHKIACKPVEQAMASSTKTGSVKSKKKKKYQPNKPSTQRPSNSANPLPVPRSIASKKQQRKALASKPTTDAPAPASNLSQLQEKALELAAEPVSSTTIKSKSSAAPPSDTVMSAVGTEESVEPSKPVPRNSPRKKKTKKRVLGECIYRKCTEVSRNILEGEDRFLLNLRSESSSVGSVRRSYLHCACYRAMYAERGGTESAFLESWTSKGEHVTLVRQHTRDFCGKMTTNDIYKESTQRAVRPVIPIPSAPKQQTQIPANKRRKRKRRRRKGKGRDCSVGPDDHESNENMDSTRKAPSTVDEGPSVVVVNKGRHLQEQPKIVPDKNEPAPVKPDNDSSTHDRTPDKPANDSVSTATLDAKDVDNNKEQTGADTKTSKTANSTKQAVVLQQEQKNSSSVLADKPPPPPAAKSATDVTVSKPTQSSNTLPKPEVDSESATSATNKKIINPTQTSHASVTDKESKRTRSNSDSHLQQNQSATDLGSATSHAPLQVSTHTTQPAPSQKHFSTPSNPWSNPGVWSKTNPHRASTKHPIGFAAEPQRMPPGISMMTNPRAVNPTHHQHTQPPGLFGDAGPFGQMSSSVSLPQQRASSVRPQPAPIGAHRPHRSRQQRSVGPIGKQTTSVPGSHHGGMSGARPPTSFNIFGTGSLFSGTWGPQPADSASLNDDDGGNSGGATSAAKSARNDWAAPIPMGTPGASAWSSMASVPSNPWGRNAFGSHLTPTARPSELNQTGNKEL